MTGRRDQSDPREAFTELYQATRHDLLRYLLRRMTDAEEAADLLAETFATAWDKLEAIPPGEEARLWLFGVARNLLLRSVRRRRVADALVERLAGELRSAPTGSPRDEQADTRWRDEHADTRLRDALVELSERDREIVMLAAWEDLTPREIAQVIGTSANAVRIRLHRARRQLQQRLAVDPEPAPWRVVATSIDS